MKGHAWLISCDRGRFQVSKSIGGQVYQACMPCFLAIQPVPTLLEKVQAFPQGIPVAACKEALSHTWSLKQFLLTTAELGTSLSCFPSRDSSRSTARFTRVLAPLAGQHLAVGGQSSLPHNTAKQLRRFRGLRVGFSSLPAGLVQQGLTDSAFLLG